MTENQSPTKQQIGRSGELLVQYSLLRKGIESSQMTIDTGIDLVAFSGAKRKAITIQVKANLKAKPAGGKGKLALDWWAPEESKADFYAFVDLESQGIWLVGHRELAKLAQQKSSGRLHLYIYLDPNAKPRADKKKVRMYEFEKYRLENRVKKVFG